jgi:CRP-like cAMP-binding protein
MTTVRIFYFPLITREAKIDRPLNAIKKTAPTAAARIRSTSKVCIFKHLLSVSALPYGQPIYRPPSSVEKSLPPNVEMNSRRPMSIVSDRRSINCKYPLAEVRRAYSAMSEQNCSLWIGVSGYAELCSRTMLMSVSGPQRAAMIPTLHDEVGFLELFTAHLLYRNSRIEEDLIDQLFNSSEKRLARVLLLLANFGKEATTEPIIGKFSQETFAEMVGTTRSRVSFFMNKFRKLGYIEYNGKLEIRNSLLNVILYDKPEIRKDDASNGPR